MTGHLEIKSPWGPFSSTYLGSSRILDSDLGLLADFPLTIARREPADVVLPDNNFGYVQHLQSGDRKAAIRTVPENISPDYRSFSLRYFLSSAEEVVARYQVESPDRLRCDLAFSNNSARAQEYRFGVGVVASDPRRSVRLKAELRPWWVAARDYATIEAYQKAFGLGCRQCLTRVFSWGIEDEVLAQAFGGWSDDRVIYRATLPSPLKDGYLYFRYIKYGELNPAWEIKVNGKAIRFHFPQTWAIQGGGWGKNRDTYEEWRLLRIPIGEIADPAVTIELRPLEAPGNDMARIWLDGLLFSEGFLPGDEGDSELVSTTLSDEPLRKGAAVELEESSASKVSFSIRVADAPCFGAAVIANGTLFEARYGTGSLLATIREQHGLSPVSLERDSMVSPWGAIESEWIEVSPGDLRTVSFWIEIASGKKDELFDSAFEKAPPQPCGPYQGVCTALQDILLFNVNYPLSLFDGPSAYVVPSKFFPVPYSWDGGLAAIGFTTFVPELAWKQARYFLADEKYDFPHLYAGSPVPTPLYALWEAYQATGDLETLAQAYPGARRMYDFYLGRTPGSVVNAHGDGLLSTYAYNYNLGIDDHPIQRWAEEHGVTSKGLYSIILMAQMLRIARIMRNTAAVLNLEQDVIQYGEDVRLLSDQIEGRMWDEESGLYGWLYREGDEVVSVRLDGCAGDRSGCGFFPLFAGLGTHKDRLLPQLFDTTRFATPHGISSVDRSAPSYNPNGYWNGGIWPVMQWFLWRGLLETGEPELARRIADTILRTWQNAWEKEHYLGEHFMIEKEQMNGAPNFGGLSAILLPMNAAYYTPYHVTSSYDVIVHRRETDRQNDRQNDRLVLEISAPYLSAESHSLLVNMGGSHTRYQLIRDGVPYGESISDGGGHLCWQLPQPAGRELLRIERAETL